MGRLHTRYAPVRRSPPGIATCDAPRLACVRPAASVHPEPGSNSPLYKNNVLLESWLFVYPLKGNWQINTTIFSQNIISNSKNQFKKASHFGCERDCKDKCYFSIRQIFFKVFFFAVSCETFAKGTAKISNLLQTSKNFFKNFASYWNSDYKPASSSFIVNPRLICKNRYFSNADAKVATFFEPANIFAYFLHES